MRPKRKNVEGKIWNLIVMVTSEIAVACFNNDNNNNNNNNTNNNNIIIIN